MSSVQLQEECVLHQARAADARADLESALSDLEQHKESLKSIDETITEAQLIRQTNEELESSMTRMRGETNKDREALDEALQRATDIEKDIQRVRMSCSSELRESVGVIKSAVDNENKARRVALDQVLVVVNSETREFRRIKETLANLPGERRDTVTLEKASDALRLLATEKLPTEELRNLLADTKSAVDKWKSSQLSLEETERAGRLRVDAALASVKNSMKNIAEAEHENRVLAAELGRTVKLAEERAREVKERTSAVVALEGELSRAQKVQRDSASTNEILEGQLNAQDALINTGFKQLDELIGKLGSSDQSMMEARAEAAETDAIKANALSQRLAAELTETEKALDDVKESFRLATEGFDRDVFDKIALQLEALESAARRPVEVQLGELRSIFETTIRSALESRGMTEKAAAAAHRKEIEAEIERAVTGMRLEQASLLEIQKVEITKAEANFDQHSLSLRKKFEQLLSDATEDHKEQVGKLSSAEARSRETIAKLRDDLATLTDDNRKLRAEGEPHRHAAELLRAELRAMRATRVQLPTGGNEVSQLPAKISELRLAHDAAMAESRSRHAAELKRLGSSLEVAQRTALDAASEMVSARSADIGGKVTAVSETVKMAMQQIRSLESRAMRQQAKAVAASDEILRLRRELETARSEYLVASRVSPQRPVEMGVDSELHEYVSILESQRDALEHSIGRMKDMSDERNLRLHQRIQDLECQVREARREEYGTRSLKNELAEARADLERTTNELGKERIRGVNIIGMEKEIELLRSLQSKPGNEYDTSLLLGSLERVEAHLRTISGAQTDLTDRAAELRRIATEIRRMDGNQSSSTHMKMLDDIQGSLDSRQTKITEFLDRLLSDGDIKIDVASIRNQINELERSAGGIGRSLQKIAESASGNDSLDGLYETLQRKYNSTSAELRRVLDENKRLHRLANEPRERMPSVTTTTEVQRRLDEIQTTYDSMSGQNAAAARDEIDQLYGEFEMEIKRAGTRNEQLRETIDKLRGILGAQASKVSELNGLLTELDENCESAQDTARHIQPTTFEGLGIVDRIVAVASSLIERLAGSPRSTRFVTSSNSRSISSATRVMSPERPPATFSSVTPQRHIGARKRSAEEDTEDYEDSLSQARSGRKRTLLQNFFNRNT